MKNTKIFYFDVDGTLLDNKSNSISENTIYSLKKLKELGYKVALCTGRTYEGVQEANLENLIEWDGYVLANGSQVLNKKKETIFESQVDKDVIHKIQAFIGKKAMLMEGPKNFLTYKAHAPILKALDHFGIDEEYKIEAFDQQIVYNALVYDELSDELIKEISPKVQILRDQLGNYELIPFDSGKNIGIQKLNKLLGLEYHVVFGDGENDVTMVRDADYSVAMGNSVESLKEIAHYVTDHVNNDGVYKALLQHKIFRKDV